MPLLSFTLQVAPQVCPHDNWFEIPQNMAPDLAILLQKYKQVCVALKGLPPSRYQNHDIPFM